MSPVHVTRLWGAIAGPAPDIPGPPGRRYQVLLIRPGRSQNGHCYRPEVLQASLPLWAGAAAFADHPDALDQTRPGGRSVRDLVGVIEAPHAAPDGLRATLRLYPTAGWLADLLDQILADRAAGRPVPPVGLSADLRVRRQPAADGWEIVAIDEVVSADIVFRPPAGGTVLAAEGATLLPAITPGSARSEEKEAPMSEQPSPTVPTPAPAPPDLAAEVTALRQARAAWLLEARLAQAGLPEPAAALLRQRFQGRLFAAEDLDREIADLRQVLAAVAQPAVIQGAGQPRPPVTDRQVLTARERLQVALDRLFDLPVPDSLREIPRLSGLREAYIAITGDRHFTGRYQPADAAIREANEVTTTVLNDLLGASMAKRLVRDYQAQPKWWEPVVVVVALSDMKSQDRVTLNDFASLAPVAENGAYANLPWGDSKESYTPTKRGNLVTVTLEMILNDDTRAVTRLPSKLAAAAAATVNEFVAGLFSQNAGAGPLMADGLPVFDAGHQGNKLTSPLSSAALQTALVTMLKFTNTAGKRIGVLGRYLLVPPDLFYAARILTESEREAGTPNNDINPLRGQIQPVLVPNWTDSNNWYLLAAPSQIEGLELGFLNGRQEPELLVQDSPTAGAVFTNDALTWKVRHIFGGGWLDYRAAVGAIMP